MPEGCAWFTVVGDGRAVQGPCEVWGFVFWPDSDADYADVYDGLDTTGGRFFQRLETAASTTLVVAFAKPLHFGDGVYVDGKDSAVKTTVVFEQA